MNVFVQVGLTTSYIGERGSVVVDDQVGFFRRFDRRHRLRRCLDLHTRKSNSIAIDGVELHLGTPDWSTVLDLHAEINASAAGLSADITIPVGEPRPAGCAKTQFAFGVGK